MNSAIRRWNEAWGLKYGFAALSTFALLVLMFLTGETLWLLPVLLGWELIGVVWFVGFSQYGLYGWRRRHFWHPPSGAKRVGRWLFLVFYVFCWPLWVAFGESDRYLPR